MIDASLKNDILRLICLIYTYKKTGDIREYNCELIEDICRKLDVDFCDAISGRIDLNNYRF